jgi:hypothetical protein
MQGNSRSEMQSLFTIRGSNKHQTLLLGDISRWNLIDAEINKVPFTKEVSPYEFYFRQFGEDDNNVPDVCTVYISGAIAFRADLKDQLFPSASEKLEFLSIKASGVPWLLLNCLQAASSIKAEGSEVMRGLNGDICFVMKVIVNDLKAKEWDVFTLADSNRAQLFVTEAFRTRFEKLKLKGITFQAIGAIE